MARPISISRRRRNSELTMIVMVALITGGGYTLAALGTNSEIPARDRAVRRRRRRAARRRPHRRADPRPRRRLHAATARRLPARHRLRDDHPHRRGPRCPADPVVGRLRRRVHRHPCPRPTPPTSPVSSGCCS
ncbi:MAG: hypothetical protein WKF58_15820 [Ilumatobacteraceae bacterium]